MHGSDALLFALMGMSAAIFLLALSAQVAQRAKVPEVLAFLVAGFMARVGIDVLAPGFAQAAQHSDVLNAVLLGGSLLLLYESGMHTSRGEMLRVGPLGTAVACVGVVVPFVALYILADVLLGSDSNVALFTGATFVATSVGITADVFKSLGAHQTRAASIVLAAGVIDDVLGLVILSAVGRVVTAGSVDVSTLLTIIASATAFVVVWVAIGEIAADTLARTIARWAPSDVVQGAFVLCWCMVGAGTAQWVGLSPIVGAFGAGMSLQREHLSGFRTQVDHLPQVTEQLRNISVPMFFGATAFGIDPAAFAQPLTMGIGLVIGVVAIITKLPTGLLVGPADRWAVAVGMAPRGEVGLVFLAAGSSLGVFTPEIYAALMVALVVSTLGPILLLPYVLQGSEEGTPQNS